MSLSSRVLESIIAASEDAYATFRLGRRCGQGRVGIFRPGVLGIAGPQVLADQCVGVGPEAGQVVGDLGNAHVRREQVHQHADAAAGDPRRLEQAKHLLNPHRQDRRPAGLILQRDPAAAGHFDPLGRFAVDRLKLLPGEQSP